ncbi:hypothetical protein AOQ73_24345 [Bradyrhizobium pachyrhizi]|nr:hypothetical protein AOQ73_24345 [Bradyrhizobium pachyrhizi]
MKRGHVYFVRPYHSLFRPPTAQQIAIAVTRHPLSASKMTFESPARADRVKARINTKHNAGHFAPISVVGFGIKKTHIGDGVLLVVWREVGRAGRQIGDIGIRRHCLKLATN